MLLIVGISDLRTVISGELRCPSPDPVAVIRNLQGGSWTQTLRPGCSQGVSSTWSQPLWEWDIQTYWKDHTVLCHSCRSGGGGGGEGRGDGGEGGRPPPHFLPTQAFRALRPVGSEVEG